MIVITENSFNRHEDNWSCVSECIGALFSKLPLNSTDVDRRQEVVGRLLKLDHMAKQKVIVSGHRLSSDHIWNWYPSG